MKIRESGMPDKEMWESFFDPEFYLMELGLNRACRTVVDLGCGYGTFTIPAARMINGYVNALNIDESFIAVCETRVKEAGINNVNSQQGDFISEGTGITDNTADYVMLFNMLYAEHPLVILREVFRILVLTGKIGVIH